MEFRDLKRQYLFMKKEIDQSIFKVLQNGTYISGDEIDVLEEKLANYIGSKHCITCANGTDALLLALKTWNIGKGNAVFVPDFTFFSTGEVVAETGALPVFVDIDPNTYNICPLSLERAIQNMIIKDNVIPRAIICVDLFGQPADFPAISRIAKSYNLLLLEDGAQGFGGAIGCKKACSFGDISTTSFFPAKPLGCYGDGGAVFTDNDEWADTIRSLCVHGKGSSKYDNVRIGMNSRLDTLQAAVLNSKFPYFTDTELPAVNFIASYYTEHLKNYAKTPVIENGFSSSWAQYTIQLQSENERNGLQAFLVQNKIPCFIYYPKTMSEQKAFGQNYLDSNCSYSKYVSRHILQLPIHPYMENEEIDMVCHYVTAYLTAPHIV